MFAEPALTRFDLRFSVAGIPVRIHPLFWLIAVLLGFSAGDPLFIVIWVAVVLISILVHEFGHALAFRALGERSKVVLYGMGGLTIPESATWGGLGQRTYGTAQRVLISAAGPAAGFGLAFVVFVAAIAGMLTTAALFENFYVQALFDALLWVNVVWGLVNLAPVLPLDGGQIARSILERLDPLGGLRKALWVSTITGGVIAVVAFFTQYYFAAFLFFMLAAGSSRLLRGSGASGLS
ncbi:MAG TPA: site-2 protease family protein [Anaerolineales bacterium]|nr:site-2 protease family protein [Anaerolineales bacterium]